MQKLGETALGRQRRQARNMFFIYKKPVQEMKGELSSIDRFPTMNYSSDEVRKSAEIDERGNRMSVEERKIMGDYGWMAAKSQVEERPFTSETAVIGSLIARFREFWNSISTKWYVRPLLQQQNEFNRLITQAIQEHDEWLIALDREQTALTHNTAEITAQLIQMNRLLQSVDEKLSRLEARQ